MPIQQQLIIFARAPEYGQVKKRLARQIGKQRALAFYTRTLARLLAEVTGGPWNLMVATDTTRAGSHPIFKGHATMVQPPGDLGQRMSWVLEQFAGQHRLLIGSDIPSVRQAHIQQAFHSLKNHEVVFGPAVDGGYWLVGCSSEFSAGLSHGRVFMEGVRWSTQHALADTLDTLPQEARTTMVTTLEDVDNVESYQRYMVSARGAT